MTAVDYFRRAIWLPILLPLLALPELLIAYSFDLKRCLFPFSGSEHSPLTVVALFLVTSLIWGGMPYLTLIGLSWRLLLVGNVADWKRFLILAPWKFLLLLIPSVICTAWILDHCHLDTIFTGIIFYVYVGTIAGAIVMGHLYVVLIMVLFKLFQWLGFVKSE